MSLAVRTRLGGCWLGGMTGAVPAPPALPLKLAELNSALTVLVPLRCPCQVPLTSKAFYPDELSET